MDVNRKRILLLLTIGFFSLSEVSFSLSSVEKRKNWHPIFSLSAGMVNTSDAGTSQAFPIEDPITDEFFNYSAHHSNQISKLFNGYIGLEWNMQSPWLLQIGVDYTQSSEFFAKGTLVQGADIGSQDIYAYSYNIATKQALFLGKALYSIKGWIHPFMLGGIGAAFNQAYHYETNVPPFLTFTKMYNNHSSTSFSYAIGVGVDIDITSQLRLGLGYRFTDLGRVSLGNAVIDDVSVPGTLSQSHLYANQVLAQLTLLI